MSFLVRVLFLSTVLLPAKLFAQDAPTDSIASPTAIEEVLPDSSNFVTASILLSSPGKEAFFALGHSGIRLNCPSKGLDYCFSFSTALQLGPAFNLVIILGQMKGGYEAVTFEEYIKTFADEGRGVMEYPLNLTLHEEQDLWRLMDQKIMKGPVDKFDFIKSNCTSTLMNAINSIMQSERIEYPLTEPLNMGSRDALAYVEGDIPWMEFFSLTMMSGLPAKAPIPIGLIICPAVWQRLLPEAEIVGLNGDRRPALESEPRQLLEQKYVPTPTWLTPIRAFALLLVIAILITIAEWLLKWKRVAKAFDVILFTAYTLFATYLFYASCIRMFGLFWNNLLIAFNLLPFICWLLFRKKAFYRKLFAFYSIILIAFMAYFSLYMGRIEWAHELLLATLLIRCMSNFRELTGVKGS